MHNVGVLLLSIKTLFLSANVKVSVTEGNQKSHLLFMNQELFLTGAFSLDANIATVKFVADVVINRPEMFVKGEEHVFPMGKVGDSHDLAARVHR